MQPAPETTRVLFVDDEPQILDSLRRALRSKRDEWTMAFATGGEQALELLSRTAFDVLVTDMRMPGVDGAELLRRCQHSYPGMVRIVLSGHTAMEAALRIVRTAHQFLPKPTDVTMLSETVDRAVALHALVRDEEIRRAIGGLDVLPALPSVYVALTESLARDEPDLDAISALVERDAAIGAKLLQLVNSAFFGLPKRVASIRDAVGYIGLNSLKSLVLVVGAFRALTPGEEPRGFSAERLQQRAVSAAKLARVISPRSGQAADDGYLAGLLHDIGKLLLAVRLPEPFARMLDAAQRERRALEDVEYETLGFSHAEAGAYLLALWGLPYPIVEAVAHHHKPWRVTSRSLDLVTAVHVASALASRTFAAETAPVLDEDHLRTLGVHDRLTSWMELADRVSGEPW